MNLVVRTLLGFLGPYLWVIPILLALGILSSLSEGLGIGLLIPVFEMALQDNPAATPGPLVSLIDRYTFGFSGESRLVLLGATIAGLIVVKSLILYGFVALSAWLRCWVIHFARCGLFEQLLGVGYAFIMRRDHGGLFNTLETQVSRTSESVEILSRFTISACNVLVFTTLLLLISWETTLGVTVGVVIISLFVRVMAKRAHHLGEVTVVAHRHLASRMLEMLKGMRMIRSFGREAAEREQLDSGSQQVRSNLFKMDLVAGIVQPFVEILYLPLLFGTLALAWYIDLGVPSLIVFLVLMFRMQPHVKKLHHYRVQLAAMAGPVADVASLLDRADKPYIQSGSVPFGGLTESIKFDRVEFHYEEASNGSAAVSDVSFEIKKGKTTAIVGPSGSGKSTLINLLYRFYDPVEGKILVDGRPLQDLDVANWRTHLAIAGQDANLRDESIRENIAFGRSDADQAAIVAAARQADAHDFIEALPQGYDTRVQDQGLRLSGGQRQRIGLARALVRNPDILILDEATNTLDSVSEAAIQQTLDRLSGSLTMVVIAHRLSTIRNADHIIVMDKGRVAEQGPPEELFKERGLFSHLYELQVHA